MKMRSTKEGVVSNEARSTVTPLAHGAYALSVAAAIGLLCGCPEKKTDAPAAADAASTAAPSANAPAKFDRRYAGTLGESAAVTMHLVRDGEKLSGTYAYVKIGAPIALAGTVGTDGRFTMQESVDGKVTGEFKGTLAADGTLAGTWAMPDGGKSLPFEFAESNEPVPAPAPAPAPSAQTAAPAGGKAIAPATKDVFVDFLVKLAKSNGATVTREEATKDYDGFIGETSFSPGIVDRQIAFEKKYKLPGFNSNGVSLFVADVNNDGTEDYALTDINQVSSHNERLVAVYTPKGDALKSVPIPNAAPLNRAIYHFGIPFLSVDGEGTTMRFLELEMGPGGRTIDLRPGATSRYLWKGNAFKLLDKTRG